MTHDSRDHGFSAQTEPGDPRRTMHRGIRLKDYTRTWKSVHMWNQGKNCMGRRAFRKSNKSMQPGLKLHGTHYVEVLLLDPWQCTFLLANFPNPHQDACAQLCPIILKYMLKFLNPHQDACAQLCPTILKIYISTDVKHHVDAYPNMHIDTYAIY